MALTRCGELAFRTPSDIDQGESPTNMAVSHKNSGSNTEIHNFIISAAPSSPSYSTEARRVPHQQHTPMALKYSRRARVHG